MKYGVWIYLIILEADKAVIIRDDRTAAGADQLEMGTLLTE
jgi:hypothetical protein